MEERRPPCQHRRILGRTNGVSRPALCRGHRAPHRAIDVPWHTNLTHTGVPVFKSREELQQLYRDAGVSDNAVIVTYCRTGMQASVTYFVLRYLGSDVHLYDGSYVEWSREEYGPANSSLDR